MSEPLRYPTAVMRVNRPGIATFSGNGCTVCLPGAKVSTIYDFKWVTSLRAKIVK